jgi:hypothetical protein
VPITFIARCGSRHRKEYGVIKGDVPGTLHRDEDRTRRHELDAANEVIILDYVMLDFVDETLNTRQDQQSKIMEDAGLLH